MNMRGTLGSWPRRSASCPFLCLPGSAADFLCGLGAVNCPLWAWCSNFGAGWKGGSSIVVPSQLILEAFGCGWM